MKKTVYEPSRMLTDLENVLREALAPLTSTPVEVEMEWNEEIRARLTLTLKPFAQFVFAVWFGVADSIKQAWEEARDV